jgi:NAD(P)-dependent dehydrogenase (short-subunit alcohol dehydrogenase family)
MTTRTILITGCSSGIGEACARGLRARGWRVFATARTPEDLARLDSEGFEALHLDYRDEASVTAAADEVLARTGGRLYALFNNGAYGQPGAVEDLPTSALREQFEANFFGWHTLTRRVLPAMRAAGEGRIVQCSSILGVIALKYRGAYTASKFALEGLSDTLRLELRGTGIHVSLIEPGPIRSRFVEHALEAFRRNIDTEHSPHRDAYRRRETRFQRGGAVRFKLGPEAVLEKLVHAVESPRPKPRYRVTTPTHVMAALRRVLPNRALDAALAAASDRES